MYDRTMPDVHLEMRLTMPETPLGGELPDGYRIRFWRPGEERDWARIETSAGEFECIEDGLAGFNAYFRADALLLPERMLFVVDQNDIPVGTTTAWFNGERGNLHWVAVQEAEQGKGLARPMIAAALRRLSLLGYREVTLGTQPPSWVAIRLYRAAGFRPIRRENNAVLDGWQKTYDRMGRELTEEEWAK